ncbi:MAG TPA: SGNH/GDSL hydrolase family protein [Fimbriiglobus sp.]|jgi:lysophospholipase L1-like esterase
MTGLFVLFAICAFLPLDPPKLGLKDGDRIVWLGGTLVEREQQYGYWETALHAAFPKINFTLRNLGWSGDTVWGESRGRFDYANPNFCFRQLVDQTLSLKPTVIFICYGANESFAGEAGLPKFEKGLEALLDALKPAKAKIVLFSPIPAEPPTPMIEWRNKEISRYSSIIQTTAQKRGIQFADLYDRGIFLIRARDSFPLSANGIHLSENGYRNTTRAFLGALGLNAKKTDSMDLEPLRTPIVAKNQLFFYRWRPQNETYLTGFRKHEQGKNAKEVAEFDPLVDKAEKEIERQRKELFR